MAVWNSSYLDAPALCWDTNSLGQVRDITGSSGDGGNRFDKACGFLDPGNYTIITTDDNCFNDPNYASCLSHAAIQQTETFDVIAENTPAGNDIKVQPGDATTGTSPVSVTFDNVTEAGATNLVTSSSGSTPPTGFSLGAPPTYYDPTTTASFSGPISTCIDYSGVSYVDESRLRIFHLEGSLWIDRTISLDTTNNIICASTTSLSPFAIFEPTYATTVQQPINSGGSSLFKAERGVIPAKFTATFGGVATCSLPPATISLTRTVGGTVGPVNENVYATPADDGSNFRISSCQYIYVLGTSHLGPGTYQIDVHILGKIVGNAVFSLR